MSLNPITYSPVAKTYLAAGKPIKPAAVRAAVQAVATGAADKVAGLGAKLDSGEINLPQFMLDLRSTVKAAHLAAAAAAAGGLKQLTPKDLGNLGSKLKSLYQGLNDLENQYRSEGMSAAQFAAHAAGYAAAAAGTHENAVRQATIEAGDVTEERRVLGASNHCGDCESYAAMGWQPVGTLPDIGTACACRGRCNCSFIYRNGPPDGDD